MRESLGGGLPYLGMVMTLFLRLSIRLGPYFMPHHKRIDMLILQKNRLSHLVPEIHKVGLIFHQDILFNSFYIFYINFLLDFQSN